jgi:hypothetical protein
MVTIQQASSNQETSKQQTVLCPKGSLNDHEPNCSNLSLQDCKLCSFRFKVLEIKGETDKGHSFLLQKAIAAKQFSTRLQPPCSNHFLEIKGEKQKALLFAAIISLHGQTVKHEIAASLLRLIHTHRHNRESSPVGGLPQNQQRQQKAISKTGSIKIKAVIAKHLRRIATELPRETGRIDQ